MLDGELRTPLLSDAISDNQQIEDTAVEPFSSEHEKGFGFHDDYESVGGVPTRVIEPSKNDAHFSSIVFSSDGSFMATGESNGTIKSWETQNYSNVHSKTDLVKKVSALTFKTHQNDALMVFDDVRLQKIHLRDSPQHESSETRTTSRDLSSQCCELDPGVRFPSFSKDGRTLMLLSSNVIITFDVNRTETHPNRLKIVQDNRKCFPSISENGHGVLAVFENVSQSNNLQIEKRVFVWENVYVNQEPIVLEEERAVWGVNNEFILGWSSQHPGSTLTVYRTKDLRSCPEKTVLGQKRFHSELHLVKARMLPSEDKNVTILISESGKEGWRRMIVWNVTENSITNEIRFKMKGMDDLFREEEQHLEHRRSSRLVERRSKERLLENCAQEANLICMSSNGRWFAEFCPVAQSVVVCDAQSGVEVWSFTLPKEWHNDPEKLSPSIRFDPKGLHLLLAADKAIFAFAPMMLNMTASVEISKPERIPNGPWRTSCDDTHKNVLKSLSQLPSKAMTVALCNRIAVQKYWTMRTKNGNIVSAKMMTDCVYLEALDAFVCIACSEKDETAIVFYERVGKLYGRCFLKYPDEVDEMPRRVWPCENQGGSGFVVVFGDRELKVVFFVVKLKTNPVRLRYRYTMLPSAPIDIGRCHAVSQTQNQKQLIFVSTEGVKMLDLKTGLSENVKFNVSMTKTYQDISRMVEWMGSEGKGWQQRSTGRFVSDDGQSVLLGWDIENQRSLVIHSKTKESQLSKMLNAAGSLSEFCSLSPNGRFTLYIDINAAKKGNIDICIFDESRKRTTWSVTVIEAFCPSKLKSTEQEEVLSRVLYAFSENGSSLIVYTDDLEIEKAAFTMNESLLQFRPHGMNGLHSVNERSNFDAAYIRKICSKLGRYALNAVTERKTSIVQEALVHENVAAIRAVKEIAKELSTEIGLDWIQANGNEINFLESAAIFEPSKSKVKLAIDLIESKLVPFVSSARIVGKRFLDLLKGSQDIAHRSLLNNAFITEASSFSVNLEIFDTKRQNRRLKIFNTFDEYYEWTDFSDAQTLAAKWESKVIQKRSSKTNSQTLTSTLTGKLMFVAIEDAAKVGMDGMIRPLLAMDTPADIFDTDAVTWTVGFKWRIWKYRLMQDAAFYVLFLMIFMGYCLEVSHHYPPQDDSKGQRALEVILLLAIVAFGTRYLVEEILQIRSYTNDGKAMFESQSWGLRYHFSSMWNWLDMISSFVLVFLIPILHVLCFFRHIPHHVENILAVVVALEAILVFVKIWYFMQAFEGTGSLVLLVGNVVRDIVRFLFLAFAVMMGFAVAMRVLNVHSDISYNTGASDVTRTLLEHSFDEDLYSEAYGSLYMSLLTLFAALTGNYDLETYTNSGPLSVIKVIMLVAYLATEAIVLLNLLIAIMGDTFFRVKSSERAHWTLARAKIIDSSEASLFEYQVKHLNDSTGKYVSAIIPKDQIQTATPNELQEQRMQVSSDTVLISEMQSLLRAVQQRMSTIEEKLDSLIDANARNKSGTNAIRSGKDIIPPARNEMQAADKRSVCRGSERIAEDVVRHRSRDLGEGTSNSMSYLRDLGDEEMEYEILAEEADIQKPESSVEIKVSETASLEMTCELTEIAIQAIKRDDALGLEETLLSGLHYETIFNSRDEVHGDGNKTLLHWCATFDSVQCATLLINFGADLESRLISGSRPLHLCAIHRSNHVAKVLIDNDAKVNSRDNKGWNPIHIASQNGHLGLIKIFIEHHADVNANGADGWTSLHLASQNGHVDVVRFLLGHEALIDVKTKSERTALHIAARHGRVDVVNVLLESGADADAVDDQQATPLMIASRHRFAEVIELLTRSGATIRRDLRFHYQENQNAQEEFMRVSIGVVSDREETENEEWTRLQSETAKGHIENVKTLIRGGAELDFKTKNGKTALHIACENGNYDIVQVLVKSGASVDAQTNDGKTALHIASEKGLVNIVEALIRKKASPNVVSSNDMTPLHLATQNGHDYVMQILIENGAEINAKTSRGWTPLHIASAFGSFYVAKVLIEKGARIDLKTQSGYTSLHLASGNNQMQILIALISKGAEVNSRTKDLWTPLHAAAQKGHVEVLKILLKKGAEIDARTIRNSTPIHLAAQNGFLHIVEALTEANAQLEDKESDGFTPLHIATEKGRYDIAKFLIEKGVSIDAKTDIGWTALQIAAREGHVAFIKLLIENGAQINEKTNKGWTPLHLAAQEGFVAIVSTLIEKGAQIDPYTKRQLTPLHIASQKGCLNVVKVLLEKGARIDSRTQQKSTPLHYAAMNGHVAVAKILIEFGAKVEDKDEEGYTALHVASKEGHESFVGFLLDSGALVDEKTNYGWIPLHNAAHKGHVNVLKLLIERTSPIEARIARDATALHLAAQGGHVDAVKLLVAHGVPIDVTDEDKWTPLHIATQKRMVNVVEALIELGADIDAKTKIEWTCLHLVSSDDILEIAEVLIEARAQLESKTDKGMTPLHIACKNGKATMVQLLVEKGASLEAKTNRESTPLLLASQNGHVEVIQILIQKGASIETKDDSQWTCLHVATQYNLVNVVQALLKMGADIDCRTKNGWTPLHLAAQDGHIDIAMILIEGGASLDATTNLGSTPLHIASQKSHFEIVKFLIIKGASIEAKTKNSWTALHYAALAKSTDIVKYLIDKGGLIEAEDDDQWTPLLIASDKGFLDVVKVLVSKGAQINKQESCGWTTLHFCAQNGHVDVVKFLIDNGGNADILTNNGLTAIQVARSNNQIEVMNILIASQTTP